MADSIRVSAVFEGLASMSGHGSFACSGAAEEGMEDGSIVRYSRHCNSLGSIGVFWRC
jgi:hypothetical protein